MRQHVVPVAGHDLRSNRRASARLLPERLELWVFLEVLPRHADVRCDGYGRQHPWARRHAERELHSLSSGDVQCV